MPSYVFFTLDDKIGDAAEPVEMKAATPFSSFALLLRSLIFRSGDWSGSGNDGNPETQCPGPISEIEQALRQGVDILDLEIQVEVLEY
jgi:hypothetical protein